MGALSGLLQRLGVEETYMRVYPAVPPESRVQERDLFEGVQW
jgi:hypothetical protein